MSRYPDVSIQRIATVETDRFEHREVQPHFINPCCFGEDFAAWLRGELLDLEEQGFEITAPIQEVYGWGLWSSRGRATFWLALSFVGDGPTADPGRWVVALEHSTGLLARLLGRRDEQGAAVLKARVAAILQSSHGINLLEGAV